MYLHNLGTSWCEGRQSETLLCVEQKKAESQYLETGLRSSEYMDKPVKEIYSCLFWGLNPARQSSVLIIELMG